MKTLFTIISIATVFASCKTKTAEDMSVLPLSKEAVEYGDFVKWQAAKETKANEKTVVIHKPAAVRTVTKRSNKTVANSSDETAANSSNEPVLAAPEKKGWSKAAKGAAIGAGTGAVAGAIINKKNRAVGAVIGGVVGAGVGYGIGRAKDKKDGRY